MTEILTESFCERCGTRYTFEATARRRRGTGRIRTFSRGVKNFVANDDASFAQAMAAAREDDTRTASLQQLDAFHLTFNFCMNCRQYTCRNCWNSGLGECLSCAPDLSLEALPAPFPDLAVVGPETPASTFPESVHLNVAASAWPTSDVRVVPEPAATAGPPAAESIEAAAIELTLDELAAIRNALNRHLGRPDGGPAAAPARSEGPAGLEVAEVPRAAVDATPIVAQPEGTPPATAGARPETRRFLQRFRRRRDRATPVATPTTSMGPTGDAAPVAAAQAAQAAEAAQVAAEVAAQAAEAAVAAEVAAQAAEAATPSGPPPAAAPESPPTDVAAQPTWRMVAPDSAPPGEAQPTTPAWATPGSVTRRSADAIPSSPWAARVATARSLESPVWAASSRDVLAAGAPGAAGAVGVQSCVGCGLSLSANARFCRRCGTRQG